MLNDDIEEKLLHIYHLLLDRFGHRMKWFGESPIEIITGAILVQNTSWTNVEKALSNLKDADVLDIQSLLSISPDNLARLIYPSGFYNQKAARLKRFAHWWWDRCNDKPELLSDIPTETLRSELLGINGIGPETADCILLYVLQRGKFVVDNYTRRVMSRIGFVNMDVNYNDLQSLFEENITVDSDMYRDFHAQIIALAKSYCKVNPLCESCPITNHCRKLI